MNYFNYFNCTSSGQQDAYVTITGFASLVYTSPHHVWEGVITTTETGSVLVILGKIYFREGVPRIIHD